MHINYSISVETAFWEPLILSKITDRLTKRILIWPLTNKSTSGKSFRNLHSCCCYSCCSPRSWVSL